LKSSCEILAWRSSKEIVEFAAAMYIKRCAWEAAAGEVLEYVREPYNVQD